MRVLAGPRTELVPGSAAAAVAHALAGPDASVVSLAEIGVRDLGRPLTAAEVALLRRALSVEDGVVGYICGGRPVGMGVERPAAPAAPAALQRRARVAVATDHANLTWRSPLAGPNDDDAGPRFPSMTGVYAPETAVGSLRAVDGIIVVSGVVAGVVDDAGPSAYEADLARAQGHVAVSSELVPVVIVAAHMGLRVSAVVLLAES